MSDHPIPAVSIAVVSNMLGVGPPSHRGIGAVMDRFDRIMKANGFFERAGFSCVLVMVVLDERSDPTPRMTGRSRKHGTLEYRVVVSAPSMLKCTAEEVLGVLTVVAADAVIHAGERFGLPFSEVEELRRAYATDAVLNVLAS